MDHDFAPTPATAGATSRRAMITAAAATAGLLAVDAATSASARHTPGSAAGSLARRSSSPGRPRVSAKAAAYAFAREGARVCFCGRRADLGERNQREIRAFGGEATYVRADVRREAEVTAFVDAWVRRRQSVDASLHRLRVGYP